MDLFLHIGETNKPNWNHPICPECGGVMFQTFTVTQPPIFKEGQNNESSKPSSYWRSAEKVRQQAQKKRLNTEREKLGDRDPEAIRAATIRAQRDAFEDRSPEG